MVKIGTGITPETLILAIAWFLRQQIFPDNFKIFSIASIDKGKSEKYDVLDYRPVSILKQFF